MSFFIDIFNNFLYKPLFNALVLLYEYLPGHSFGLSLIVLTLLIRVALYPLVVKSIKSQKILNELQPKLREIQQKYKGNKEKQSRAMMEFYKKEKINPLGGCLPTLIQFPILITLYYVFRNSLNPEQMINLYSWVPFPGTVSSSFFGLVDLAKPSVLLAILAGVVQFIQMKMIFPKKSKQASQKGGAMDKFSNMMQKQMLYVFPFFAFIILLKIPSAIALYWIVTALFSAFQQYLIYKPKPKLSS
ncbi:MAG: YidC/Oxa1 family membrane protein insertase [Patescibacteria group bacterium]|nr:YidC/Oxa1 family membrane protein insertase [Patescibacteria group bacterium]